MGSARRLVFACLTATLVLGCQRAAPPSATADGKPAPGGTVVVGLLGDLQSWNPYLAEDEDSYQILRLVYPSLAVEQTDYRTHPPAFAPDLATSWEWSEDHLVLTFHLNPEATWSDGVPVTSEDVVFTWRTQTAPDLGWPYATSKDFIDDVEAVDPATVRFHFSRVYPYQLMDANDGVIVPAHRWSEIPYGRWRDTDWRKLALAAGPFRIASHEPQQQITLERNPTYWRAGRPYLDRLVFRIVPSRSSLLTQLLTGDIDLLENVPPEDAERVRDAPDLHLVVFPDRGYSQIRWNLRRPPLDDVRVRRALSEAIDRRLIVDVVYDGFARPSLGPVLSDMWAFDTQLEAMPHDPADARRLLAEAGWRDSDGDGVLDRDGKPLTLELLTNAESELRQDTCLLVQEDLAGVGVEAEPRFVEWGTLLARERKGDFDGIISRWIEPTMVDLWEVWHSAAPGEPTLNSTGYAKPEVDRLLEQIDEATTFSAQKPLLDRVQQLIVADQPYTFLVETMALVGLNDRVHGADINDAGPYFNVDQWYVNTVPQ